MAELFRYAAFISYSSKDAAFARRLHRALESYGIPSSLGKFDLIGGGKKNRIYPVFRDREELAAGHLGDVIETNLKASAALIVVCSPNAAASPWVQKEIEYFAGLGRGDKIFAIVSDNAPIVDESGADATAACFPPAFRGDALAGDKLEPLAADARKGKDGFRNAWLKVIGGLIGVSPGQIINRDRRRRRGRALRLGIAIASATALLGSFFSLVYAHAWRTRLAAFSQTLDDHGAPLDALPFAVASLPARGDLVSAYGDRVVSVISRVGSARIAQDLGTVIDAETPSRGNYIAMLNNSDLIVYSLSDGVRTDLGEFNLSAMSRDGAWLAAFDPNGHIKAWPMARLTHPIDLGPANGGTMRMVGHMLFVWAPHANGSLYDLDHGGSRIDLGAIHQPASLGVSADGSTFVARTFDGNGILMSVVNGVPHLTPLGRLDRDFDVSFDGAVLLDGDHVRVLRPNAAAPQLGTGVTFARVRLSFDGRTLAALRADQTAFAMRLSDGAKTELGAMGQTRMFALSGDGSLVIVQRANGTAVVFDLAHGGAKSELAGVERYDNFLLNTDTATVLAIQGNYGTRDHQGLGALYMLRQGARKIDLSAFGSLQPGEAQVSPDGLSFVLGNHLYNTATHTVTDLNATSSIGNGRRSIVMTDDGGHLIVRDSDDHLVVYDLRHPPALNGAADLAQVTCATNASAMRPFAWNHSNDRDTDQIVWSVVAGRLWNPCDWRGLGAILPNSRTGDAWFEGPRQWLRLRAFEFGWARPHRCSDTTYGASTAVRAQRLNACKLYADEENR